MIDSVCTCGPGPVGGPGWDAACPQHNVKELLKAPPRFNPDTLLERTTAFFADRGVPDPFIGPGDSDPDPLEPPRTEALCPDCFCYHRPGVECYP